MHIKIFFQKDHIIQGCHQSMLFIVDHCLTKYNSKSLNKLTRSWFQWSPNVFLSNPKGTSCFLLQFMYPDLFVFYDVEHKSSFKWGHACTCLMIFCDFSNVMLMVLNFLGLDFILLFIWFDYILEITFTPNWFILAFTCELKL